MHIHRARALQGREYFVHEDHGGLEEENENENDEFNVCLYELEWDKYRWKT